MKIEDLTKKSDIRDMRKYGHLPKDDYGKPVVRTHYSHPYSFDTYVQWQNPDVKNNHKMLGDYSDRLFCWDPEKYNKCHVEVWGNQAQNFYPGSTAFYNGEPTDSDLGDPSLIEAFLKLYHEDESIVLVRVLCGCNVSNGFPVWFFRYTTKDKLKESNSDV